MEKYRITNDGRKEVVWSQFFMPPVANRLLKIQRERQLTSQWIYRRSIEALQSIDGL